MSYQDDLRLLVSMIPEEIQDDDSFNASQNLLTLIEQQRYTRDEVTAALNAGANLAQEHEYEDSDTIRMDDAVNLAVNAGLYLLDHPDASLDEIIVASYTDVELDIYEFRDLVSDGSGVSNEPLPEKGTPQWNAALVRKVKGWLA
jgi:hypothetical protein